MGNADGSQYFWKVTFCWPEKVNGTSANAQAGNMRDDSEGERLACKQFVHHEEEYALTILPIIFVLFV